MPAPVICENENCRTVWFTDAFNISAVGNAKITAIVKGNRVAGCPKCGGIGAIPDGTYTEHGIEFYDPEQWKTVSLALKRIHASILAGATVEEVQEEIEKDDRLKKYLSGFIPRDLKDLQALCVIISMIFAAYAFLTKLGDKNQKIEIPDPTAIKQSLNPDTGTSHKPSQ